MARATSNITVNVEGSLTVPVLVKVFQKEDGPVHAYDRLVALPAVPRAGDSIVLDDEHHQEAVEVKYVTWHVPAERHVEGGPDGDGGDSDEIETAYSVTLVAYR